ncbi:MAG: FAD-linked oxidase C-terminal domain-containing protein [Desulfomonilaceae bacterium]
MITEIIVRLIPKPQASRTLRAEFEKLEDCSDAVAAIMAGGTVPAALELMDQFAVKAVEKSFGLGLNTDMEGVLLIQLDGNPETLEREVSQIENCLREKKAGNIIAAKDSAESERLWLARRAAGPAIMRMRPNIMTEDVTVPVSKLTAMIRKIMEIGKHYRIEVGILAHAGDGNLHPCIVFDRSNEDEYKRVQAFCKDLVPEALGLGGTLSGEHGIGIAKAPFLHFEMDQVAFGIMRAIKASFDPKGILNPGKFV